MKIVILSEKEVYLIKRWYMVFRNELPPYQSDLDLEKKLFNTQTDPERVVKNLK
jgi:hypothetical protein